MIFDRIVCGTDGSPAAREAERQARRLLTPGGALTLVSVQDGWNPLTPAAAAEHAEAAAEPGDRPVAGDALRRRRTVGWAPRSLVEVVVEESATLLVVGMHSRSRAAGIVLGSVATSVLHEAPTSVLLARPSSADSFPRTVVVGVERPDASSALWSAVDDLHRRLGAVIRPVTALEGLDLDDDARREVDAAHRTLHGGTVEVDDRGPVDALVDAATQADLLVVGSRGLHGLRSLGSVSERVAHRAACSVLVVREGAGAAPEV